MSHAAATVRPRDAIHPASVWIVERVRLATTEEIAATLEVESPEAGCVGARPAWSRVTLGVTRMVRRAKTGADGTPPVILFRLDAYVGGGLYRCEHFRWSPSAWSEAGLLVAWCGFPVQGFQLRAIQESGEPADLGLQWIADGEGAPAAIVRGTNVVTV